MVDRSTRSIRLLGDQEAVCLQVVAGACNHLPANRPLTGKDQTIRSDLRVDVIESTNDFVLIQIQMPKSEFSALHEAMRSPGTMNALCRAAATTRLTEAFRGSLFCATCHTDGVQHQFEAKNWVNAFWQALFHCGPGFALQRRACTPTLGPVEEHGSGGMGSGGSGGGVSTVQADGASMLGRLPGVDPRTSSTFLSSREG